MYSVVTVREASSESVPVTHMIACPLPEPSFAGDPERRVEPTTELERRLHEIWAEVLGHGEFGITDNFFAVGGHSLLVMQLQAKVDQEYDAKHSLL